MLFDVGAQWEALWLEKGKFLERSILTVYDLCFEKQCGYLVTMAQCFFPFSDHCINMSEYATSPPDTWKTHQRISRLVYIYIYI